ncbi:hypothetical protein BSN85_09880 [Bradyrhizobium brasilense]|nr:hypothetical protein BSN85_09880 [Bradyrhizobium brasilense]
MCTTLIAIICRAAPRIKGFQLLPRRSVVERTFAWFKRCCRLANDFEATVATEGVWLMIAHIRLLTRGLTAAGKVGWLISQTLMICPLPEKPTKIPPEVAR